MGRAGRYGSSVRETSGGAARGRGLQAVEIGDGFLCLGGCREHGAAVGLHDLEPVGDVAGMIRVRLVCDAEAGAQETCAGLGDHFLGGVLVVAEAAGEVAIEFGGAPHQWVISWPRQL